LTNGVRGLLDALPAGTEVTIVSTAPQPRFLVRATTDREAILKGLGLITPDRGSGRFVESLKEATQRIERDKSDFFPVIVAAATSAGDRDVRDSDVEQVMGRLEQRPTTVHVVMLSGQTQAAGGNQIDVGLAVSKYTQGTYENINAPTRLATLLPELGALIAKTHEAQRRRFQITLARPASATGDLGQISMGARAGLIVSDVSLAR
jgi:hypothetical protein